MNGQMTHLLRVLVVVFLAGIISLAASCTEKKTEVAGELSAPKIDVRDVRTDTAIDLAQLRGKVVFINFWATWCPPCREEMPSIEALHLELLKNEAFRMITIIYKDEDNAAADYMRANGYTFPLFSDSNGISAKRYGVTGVPETYLIDKKGVLRKRVIGPADWNSSEVKAYINSLLSE